MCRVAFLLFVFTTSVVGAGDLPHPDSTDRILRASCRIFAGGRRGSGVIFDADADSYRVLTNAHVVGRRGNRVGLEFEHSGYRSGRIAGRVVRSHVAPNASIDLAIVELPRSAFPGPMPVVSVAEGGAQDKGLSDGETVLTVGAQGGAAVSLQRGHIVRQTRNLIYYKPEALPGRSGSPLFDATANRIVGLVAWRTGDGHGLAMNAAQVQSFVRGEVADTERDLPSDAVPLWQTSTRLYLVTSEGCRPCELQKRAMPAGCNYQTVDITRVNAKGYNVQTTPTLMVFVDGELQATTAGLLRGDGLRTFLRRWGLTGDTPPDDNDADLEFHNGDDRNPWTNPRRSNRGPIRDRLDNAKDRFAWCVLGRWGVLVIGAIAVPLLPMIIRVVRRDRPPTPRASKTRKRTKKHKPH